MASTPISAYVAAALGKACPRPSPASAPADTAWARAALAALAAAVASGQRMDMSNLGEAPPTRSKLAALEESIHWLWHSVGTDLAARSMRPARDGSGRMLMRREAGFLGTKLGMWSIKIGPGGSLGIGKARLGSKPGTERWLPPRKHDQQIDLDWICRMAWRVAREACKASMDKLTGLNPEALGHWLESLEEAGEPELAIAEAAAKANDQCRRDWNSGIAVELGTRLGQLARDRGAATDPAGALALIETSWEKPKKEGEPFSAARLERELRRLDSDEGRARIQLHAQAPGASLILASMGPWLGENIVPGPDSARELKEILGRRFGLSPAGWKALTSLAAQEPEAMILLRAHFAYDAAKKRFGQLPCDDWAGNLQRLADGSWPTRPQALMGAFCRMATLLARGGMDLREGLAMGMGEMSKPGRGPLRPDQSCSALGQRHLKLAPNAWREAAQEVHRIRSATAPDAPERHMLAAWKALARKSGEGKASFLHPEAFARLSALGILPDDEWEAKLWSLERERSAMEGKADGSARSILSHIQRQSRRGLGWQDAVSGALDWVHLDEAAWSSFPESPGWDFIANASRHWHATAGARKAIEACWDPLLAGNEEVDCGHGFRAKELVSGEQLAKEGAELHHCVGSYAKGCAKGDRRIFSLKGPGPRARTTIEISPSLLGSWRRGKPRVAQHKGYRNAEAGPAARVAAQALLAILAAEPQARPTGWLGWAARR